MSRYETPISVILAPLAGSTYKIDGVYPSDTVRSLKLKFQEKEGMPPEQVSLVLGSTLEPGTSKIIDRQLENDRILSYYDIKDGTKILLRLSIRKKYGGTKRVRKNRKLRKTRRSRR